jgi:hypothetical protein
MLPNTSNGYFSNTLVSRKHAEIWADANGKIWIRDTKSSNGTFLNGTRLSKENQVSPPHELQDLDHLELGLNIIGDDKKTVIEHKVAARVERAGFMNTPLFDELDPPLPPVSDHFVRPLESRFGYARPQTPRPYATREVIIDEDGGHAIPHPRQPAPSRLPDLAPRPTPANSHGEMANQGKKIRPFGFVNDSDESRVGKEQAVQLASKPEQKRRFEPISSRAPLRFGGFPDLETDVHGHRIEVAGNPHRRRSYYGGRSTSFASSFERETRQAARGEDDDLGADVHDGPPDIDELTAESEGEEKVEDIQQPKGKEREAGLRRENTPEGAEDEEEYQEATAELQRVIGTKELAKRDATEVKEVLDGPRRFHIEKDLTERVEPFLHRMDLVVDEAWEDEGDQRASHTQARGSQGVTGAYKAEHVGKEKEAVETAENKKRSFAKFWVCCNCGEWNSWGKAQCFHINCKHVYKAANCNCRVEMVRIEHS